MSKKKREEPEVMTNGISRRKFIKGAAVGAVGVGIAASSLSLIGCGGPQEAEPWLPEKWDKEADVVIVGAGGAGLAAAIGAAQGEKAKVLCIEKLATSMSSSTSICGGFITFSGTDIQKRHGIIDSPDDFYKDMVEYGEETTPEVVRVYADNNLAYYELIKSLGVPFVDAISPSPGCGIPRTHIVDPAKHVQLLQKAAEEMGVEFLYKTPGQRLVTNCNKEVIGVKAEAQGKELYIKAKRGVILATGGFTHNEGMLNECIPGLGNVVKLSCPGHTGDGHKMMFEKGCWMRGRPYVYTVQGMDPNSTTMKGYVELFLYGAVQVNKEGKRFVKEDLYWSSKRTQLVMEQPVENGIVILYQVFDQQAFEKAEKAGPPIGLGPETTDLLVEADTIQDLGAKIGAKDLEVTIARYNKDIEEVGYDTVKGRRTMVGIGTPKIEKIDKSPFYAFKNTAWLAYNPTCSFIVNKELHPVDVYGELIPRLYLVGEIMARNICGNHYIYGESTGQSGGLGLVGGKNAAKEEPWE